MIRVLVVDDSSLMRLIISDILNSDKDIEVIGTASDGRDAAKKTVALKPDVVLMDMNMDKFDGKYGVREIMKKEPTPIVILSAVGNTNLEPILEAMRLGAVDYLNKPEKNKAKLRGISTRIVRRVKAAARANKSVLGKSSVIKKHHSSHSFTSHLPYDIVVVGASTGGPTAVELLIAKLPENMPIPIIIAQHMPESFIYSFAERLDTLTPLNVVVPNRHEKILPGNIYIAPGSGNMILKKNLTNEVKVDFTNKKFKDFNNPSITALMSSVAEVYGKKSIGVILTGMGKDGASGMKEIYECGGYTIAQNQATSVVYGMPKEVIENGVVKQAVSIHDMGNFIVSCIA